MDSSNGTANYKLHAIMVAVENGTLTKEEINRRLSCAISEEYQKNPSDRDTQFIMACETLLYEMHTGKPYVSRKEEYEQALFGSIDRKPENHTKHSSRTLWRMALVTCAMLILLVAADILLHREWLQGISTEDEQQYIIAGKEINPNTIPNGVADEKTNTVSIHTTDLGQIKALLGFLPSMPSVDIEGWSSSGYSAVISASSKSFSATYVNSNSQNELLFNIRYYTDVESAQNWLEQNKQGEILRLGGKEIYFGANYDNNICSWSDGAVCYSLFGPISQEQLIKIITSIEGE